MEVHFLATLLRAIYSAASSAAPTKQTWGTYTKVTLPHSWHSWHKDCHLIQQIENTRFTSLRPGESFAKGQGQITPDTELCFLWEDVTFSVYPQRILRKGLYLPFIFSFLPVPTPTPQWEEAWHLKWSVSSSLHLHIPTSSASFQYSGWVKQRYKLRSLTLETEDLSLKIWFCYFWWL